MYIYILYFFPFLYSVSTKTVPKMNRALQKTNQTEICVLKHPYFGQARFSLAQQLIFNIQ